MSDVQNMKVSVAKIMEQLAADRDALAAPNVPDA
jgi:hypothetical protein